VSCRKSLTAPPPRHFFPGGSLDFLAVYKRVGFLSLQDKFLPRPSFPFRLWLVGVLSGLPLPPTFKILFDASGVVKEFDWTLKAWLYL